MKNVNEMTLNELKALEDEIKARKAELKASAKTEKAVANTTKVDEVNKMIADKTLKLGDTIVVLYGSKNVEVVATVVGVLTVEKASITCESTYFAGKENENGTKRRYVDKSRFVKVVC